MQPTYRSYPQQQAPQRSPHAAAATSRRGIGPMISGPGAHQQNSLTPAQLQAQQHAQAVASERAKMRSRKPTDKNMPEGVEDCIIGDGVQRYRELRELERKLDSTMMRKRLDIADNVNRNVKRYRTLRIWISNTVEDQPWETNTPLDINAFDFNNNMDSSYRVKIEGRLLDEDEDELDTDESDDDEDDEVDGDAMDEDGKEVKKKTPKPQPKQYKFSHFFKAMTVEYDRSARTKEGSDHIVEWKKPIVSADAASLPNTADFDQLEFKRPGDENANIIIKLTRDENPERYRLSPILADILDTDVATRAEAVMGIWDYIKAMGLEEDEEKRSFECDEKLKALLNRDKGYIPYLPDSILSHLSPLPPIELAYTIRVDKDFHASPTPTIYDIRVQVPDPLKALLTSSLTNATYPATLREISTLNDHLSLLIAKIGNSKSKHMFFDALAKDPAGLITRWLSSQKRDLEVIAGEAMRGGGEDASAEEWRKGGADGVWGSENVRESVNLMVSAKTKV